MLYLKKSSISPKNLLLIQTRAGSRGPGLEGQIKIPKRGEKLELENPIVEQKGFFMR